MTVFTILKVTFFSVRRIDIPIKYNIFLSKNQYKFSVVVAQFADCTYFIKYIARYKLR